MFLLGQLPSSRTVGRISAKSGKRLFDQAARKSPVRQDRKFKHSVIERLFQLQNNWTGHRVSDTKAAAEIFKCVAERI